MREEAFESDPLIGGYPEDGLYSPAKDPTELPLPPSMLKASDHHQRGGGAGGAAPWQLALGVGYALAMSVCGIVLVALGNSLTLFAANLGVPALMLRSVLLSRGAGSLCGFFTSIYAYRWFHG